MVLEKIDAGETMLRATIEEGNEQLRRDVINALDMLGSGFAEMGFLIKDVAHAAAEIQRSLDTQGVDVRVIKEQNERQSADIRLVREDIAVIARQSGAGGSMGAGGERASPRWVYGCPYRGLLPFTESDAEVFYGRERLTAELAVKLAAKVHRGGLVVVTGASGAGKSSLLQAGLLPKLAQGRQVRGSERWPHVVLTPTREPLTELAVRLAALGDGDAVAIRDGLAQRPSQTHMAIWSAVHAEASASRRDQRHSMSGANGARLVLIVDQFEQVFTLNPGHGGEAERQAFITALCSAATNPVGSQQTPPALVVIAVRGDFWDRCAAYPELAGALQEGQFVVGPMTQSDLRLAITGPADAAGLRIDPALTDTILADLRAAGADDAAGVLPLLSQAMSLTWEKREGDRLTSHGYAEVGGVMHAVQTSADSVYDALPAEQQALAREVLRNMALASRDGRLSRRPVTRADLYADRPAAACSSVDAVLEAFAAKRLVVLDADTAEIAHDVLLQAWPRLRGWLEEERDSWILYGQMADAAARWIDRRRDSSFLYRGTQLSAVQEAARRWAAEPARYPALTRTESEFLAASSRNATRGARVRRGAFTILAALLAIAIFTSVVAFRAQHTASHQLGLAISGQLISQSEEQGDTNPALAKFESLAAWRINPSPQARYAMLNAAALPGIATLTGDSTPVNSVAFSPDGKTLASGSDGGMVMLQNVATGEPVGRSSTARFKLSIESVMFSPGGKALAGSSIDGTGLLWDVATHQQIGQPFPSSPGALGPVAISPDGEMLATGNTNSNVLLWDVPTRKLIGGFFAGNSSPVALAFSPDGKTLASGNGEGTVMLWDAATQKPIGQPLAGHTGAVDSVAFSPDGKTLASGDDDGTVMLWDTATQKRIGQPLASNNLGAVDSVAFSPDGKTLASGNGDGTVMLWDAATQKPIGQPLTGHTGAVDSVAFSPDGKILASGGHDGTVRLWDLAIARQQIGQPFTAGNNFGGVASVAFSPDGKILATGAYDGTVRLWDVATHQQIGQPLASRKNLGGVYSVAFSPDGKILASGNGDDTVRLWDVATHRQIGQPLHGAFGGNNYVEVNSVAFIRDGRILASGGNENTVRLWDVATHQQIGQPLTGHTAGIESVAFSPDGDILASGGNDGTARLWDVATHQQIGQPLTGHATGIESVAFSPDGDILASGGNDGTARLWDVATHQQIGQPLTGHTSQINSVVFSPDGEILASGGGDGSLQLWDVATHQQIGQPLTGQPGQINSVAFSPDGRILASGDSDGMVRLWDVNYLTEVLPLLCDQAADFLTPAQWARYIPPGAAYRKVCP